MILWEKERLILNFKVVVVDCYLKIRVNNTRKN